MCIYMNNVCLIPQWKLEDNLKESILFFSLRICWLNSCLQAWEMWFPSLPPGWADTSLAGKVPGCLEPEMGSALEALWLPPDPEAVSFCSPHSHLCRLVLAGSRKEDGSRGCSGEALLGGVDTSPLEEHFLNRTPMAYALRSIEKWKLMKLNSFCKAMDIVNRTNQQPTVWENMRASIQNI